VIEKAFLVVGFEVIIDSLEAVFFIQ